MKLASHRFFIPREVLSRCRRLRYRHYLLPNGVGVRLHKRIGQGFFVGEPVLWTCWPARAGPPDVATAGETLQLFLQRTKKAS